ncbi:DUF4097 family beta strand repeat-containing protein [Streptomyces sp. NPDC102360]|uniref:DUF4097 family beta strand repeat-containing protein n=1 Tax=Streptomyces sp. NPDC102360 TaxID=3366160 RepID=UPI0038057380
MQRFIAPAPAPIDVVLDVQAGHVEVIAADRADAVVEVRPADAARKRDAELSERTTVDLTDDVLRITAVAPVSNRILGASGAVEVTVRIPAGSRIEAASSAIEFRGTGRLGEVVLDGALGTVRIEEAGGARLTIHSGDVLVGRLTGDAEISTGKGDLTITEVTRGTVELRTQSGDITIGAARGVSAVLDAGTGYGRVHNTLENSGTPELTVRATTSYGDITAHAV